MNPDTTPVNKETLGGLLLMAAAVSALVITVVSANSPLVGLSQFRG